MYSLEGFQNNITSLYKLVAPFAIEKIKTAEDLRLPYRAFLKDVYGDVALNESSNIIVQDQKLTRALLTRIAGSRLNDLDQEDMIGDLLETTVVIEGKKDLEQALLYLQQNQLELYNLLRVAVHSIAISKSKRNRFGQRAHGGTSNGLVGLIWFALEQRLNQIDLVEMLIHELTHTLVFIDEYNYGHFNYETLTKQEYWANSAILTRSRPMDKVLHSIVVSTEILAARKNFIGEDHSRRVHPASKQLAAQTEAAITSVLTHPLLGEVCLPRSIELVKKCQNYIRLN